LYCLSIWIKVIYCFKYIIQLFYYIKYPTQCHNYLVWFKSDNRYQVMTHIQEILLVISMGVFSLAVDITMRPNVQRLIDRNIKCHVTFFRLIKFKIFIWVCKKYDCITYRGPSLSWSYGSWIYNYLCNQYP